jgi:undecaprenyl-diphosphatase
MTQADLAEFIARHVVALLATLAVLLLTLTGLLWMLVERHVPRVLALAAPYWRRLDSRQLAARYLGWHMAIAFGVAGVGLGAFFELADEIGAGEDLAEFDGALAAALGRHLDDGTLHAAGLLTHLGDPALLVPGAAAVAVVLLWRRDWLLGWAWVAGTGGGALLNRMLKALFARTRPAHEHGFAAADGYSFPSGHASGSMLVFGLAAYFIVRHTQRAWHVPATLLALLLIVFVGSSRVLLQVHYLSDVLAGWTVAAAWIALCVAGLEALRLGRSRNDLTKPRPRDPRE